LLKKCVLLGLGSALLLSVIEWVDLNFQLTPVFRSFSERLIFTAYFSMNLLSGAAIGLLVGGFARAAAFLKNKLQSALAGGRDVRLWHRLVAGLIVAALIALVFYIQPQARSYISGLIIEGQKLPYVYGKLLPFEKVLSFLILLGLVMACALTWTLSRNAEGLARWQRTGWMLLLAVLMVAAYYIDSRDQVQLYEYTLHRSMFLLATAAAMALLASLYNGSPRLRALPSSFPPAIIKLTSRTGIVVLLGAVGFSFAHLGKDQTLKAQIFSRTTQARQHIRLAQWVLDFDRDGYSVWLDGGDANDRRADINPEQPEMVEDGIDNNGIGGDVTAQSITDWHQQFTALNHRLAPAPQPLNLVYVFIDTLRADHLKCYGYPRDTSPNLDRLASRSAVFDNAYSRSANTFESAARFMKSSYWDATVDSWSEILAHNGYDVILFPERRLGMLNRYVKGARVAPNAEGKFIKETVDNAIDTLGQLPPDRPFCAYLYAVEPHRPYARHKGFEFGASLNDLYDGEIAFTDHHLGRLFDWLEQSGRMQNTMIVIMADHGESFGERGVYRHSSQLFNDQTHVPMIFYVPGQPSRRVVEYVTTIDLGATILQTVGLNVPDEYAGVTLLPLMRGEPFTHPPVYGEQTLREKEFPNIRPEDYPQPMNKKYMIITQDGFKLITNRNHWYFELFDLKNDPLEMRNLANEMPERFAAMKQQLGQYIDIVTASRPRNADEQKYFFGDRSANDVIEDVE
jgi:arylsulfatase A-like enzyme